MVASLKVFNDKNVCFVGVGGEPARWARVMMSPCYSEKNYRGNSCRIVVSVSIASGGEVMLDSVIEGHVSVSMRKKMAAIFAIINAAFVLLHKFGQIYLMAMVEQVALQLEEFAFEQVEAPFPGVKHVLIETQNLDVQRPAVPALVINDIVDHITNNPAPAIDEDVVEVKNSVVSNMVVATSMEDDDHPVSMQSFAVVIPDSVLSCTGVECKCDPGAVIMPDMAYSGDDVIVMNGDSRIPEPIVQRLMEFKSPDDNIVSINHVLGVVGTQLRDVFENSFEQYVGGDFHEFSKNRAIFVATDLYRSTELDIEISWRYGQHGLPPDLYLPYPPPLPGSPFLPPAG